MGEVTKYLEFGELLNMDKLLRPFLELRLIGCTFYIQVCLAQPRARKSAFQSVQTILY